MKKTLQKDSKYNEYDIDGHGFVNDEQVYYNVGQNSDSENTAVIGGLVDNTTYFVIASTTNTLSYQKATVTVEMKQLYH